MQTSFFTDAAASECFLRSTIFMATASPEILLTRSLTLHTITNIRGDCEVKKKEREEKKIYIKKWTIYHYTLYVKVKDMIH